MLYNFAGPTWKNPILVNFWNNTRSNMYNLNSTWSFSTGWTVLVSTHPSKEKRFPFCEKKCCISLRGRLKRIKSLSIIQNTQDQTCITWVLRYLSLSDKLCLLLSFLFYHIFIWEKERTFPFYKKMYLFWGAN